jgi:hypothetical protein
MQKNEIRAMDNSESRQRPEQVASWAHLAGLLLIGAGVVALGFLAQHAPSGSGASAGGQLAGHSQAIPLYLTAIFMDWMLLYYCWGGVHHRGGSLWTLAGGRWNSWKSVAVDLGIVAPFWVISEGAAYAVAWLLGPGSAKTVDSLRPHSLLEVLIWIGNCATAGICEEMVSCAQRQCCLSSAGAGSDFRSLPRLSGLAECNRDQRGWRFIWCSGSMEQESAREYRCSCVD